MSRILIVLLLAALPGALLAQRDGRPGGGRRDQAGQLQSPAVTFEAHSFSSPLPGMSRLDILYRIPRKFFVFARPMPADPLTARAEIGIDILDAKGVAAAHRVARRKLFSADAVDAVQGIFSFPLAPGPYTLVLEVTDGESNRSYRSDNRKIVVGDVTRGARPDILLLNPPAGSATSFTPLNEGGEAPFGEPFDLYAEVPLPESARVPVAVSIARDDSTAVVIRDTLTTTGHLLEAVAGDTVAPLYQTGGAPAGGRISGIRMHLNGDTLREGAYAVRIGAADSARTFHIRWFDKPLSLRSLPAAVDALSYITTEEEFHTMRDADPRRQEELFEEFWKKRDKTPSTAYNEVMAEYYRRVDQANQSFSSMSQRNGAKTDRGKAFILYGAPDSTSREFDPSSSPREVWLYSRLHKRLVFTDETKRGEYRLTAAEEY